MIYVKLWSGLFSYCILGKHCRRTDRRTGFRYPWVPTTEFRKGRPNYWGKRPRRWEVSFEYRVVITKTKRLPFLEGGAVLEYLLLRIRNINYRERDGGHIELSLTFLAHSSRTDNFLWYRILRMHWAPGITPVVTNLKCKMYLTVPVNSCGGKDIGPFYEQFSLQCLRELVSRCITTYASVVRLRGSKICWNQHSERMTGIVDNRWHLFVPEETSLGISDRLFGQGQGTIQAFSTVRRLQWRSRGASNRP